MKTNPFIYADNAATTRVDNDIFTEMEPFLRQRYANASQAYSFAGGSKKALEQAREDIAECIGAKTDEIYFTSGGTESDNWAIKGMLPAIGKGYIVTSTFEHHAILRSCETVGTMGYRTLYVAPNSDGFVTETALEEKLADTRLVSIMAVNNEIGTIQPIKKLSRAAHMRRAVFHTDAVQAIGHIPVDVKEWEVDMLSASAHKFNGPKGVGFLYVKNGTPISPLMDGGNQERGMRAGTENVALIVGMAAALKKNTAKLERSQIRVRRYEDFILNFLHDNGIDFIRNGASPQIAGIMSLSFGGESGETIMHRLDLMGINIATGAACDSKNTMVSHVIKAISVPAHYAVGTIRISLSRENTLSDAEAIAQALVKVLKK